MFGGYECDYAIAYAVKRGFPESLFERVPSTVGRRRRSGSVRPIDAEQGPSNTTSWFLPLSHAALRQMFQAAGPELQLTVIGAPIRSIRWRSGGKDRETLKTV